MLKALCGRLGYREVTVLDFEFRAVEGDRPVVVCMVAHELLSGRFHRLTATELATLTEAPFPTGDDALVVAFYASAEIGCFLALGWRRPANVLDLFPEARRLSNGGIARSPLAPNRKGPRGGAATGDGLLAVVSRYGLRSRAVADKDAMRELILGAETYSPREWGAILDYCDEDVADTAALLPHMLPQILGLTVAEHVEAAMDDRLPDRAGIGMAWAQALHRGSFMSAIAVMEHNGLPVDMEALNALRENWEYLQGRAIEAAASATGIYRDGTFSEAAFDAWLLREGINWPRLPSGKPELDEATFREMVRSYPQVGILHEARQFASGLRAKGLAVGSDGRNRCLLSPFQSKTGRNQPSGARFLFLQSTWMRALLRPSSGLAVAYLDWKSQEFAIAAALSDDAAMMDAYRTGDVYVAFLIAAEMVPPGSTKADCGPLRDMAKTVVLGTGYGMGAATMAARMGRTRLFAERQLRRFRAVFGIYWRWTERVVDHALQGGALETNFGWRYQPAGTVVPSEASLRNWMMQAHGAEMMRLAAVMADNAGIRILAPVHDAFVIEAAADEIEAESERMREIMVEASRAVLSDKLACDVDIEIVRHPYRYRDKRGVDFLERVKGWLAERGVNALD
jgi:DNA polymerase-1